MQTHTIAKLTLVFAIGFFIASCGLLDPDSKGPNDMDGDGNLEMTEVGKKWDVSPMLNDILPGGYSFLDSVYVKSRSGGVISMDVRLAFDRKILEKLDTLAGTHTLPMETRLLILDGLAKRFGATIDTSTPGTVRIRTEPIFKVTSEGIQEYVTSKGNTSKPFTIIKYDMKVGDSWSFTDDAGIKTTRTVTYHSETDDYPVYFWLIRVFKTESVMEGDPLLEKITYVTNHKYGTVGALVKFKSGYEFTIGVYAPTW